MRLTQIDNPNFKRSGQTSQQSNQDLKNTSGVPNAPMFQSTTGTAAAR